MNATHLHLMLNHFALVGFVFSLLLLLIGLTKSNENFLRAGFFIILISGVLTVPTYFSGEPAEDILKASSNFSEDLVEEHEAAAGFAIGFIELTAVVAGLGLWQSISKNLRSKKIVGVVLALNIFTLTVIARTSYLGGQISHPEIRNANP